MAPRKAKAAPAPAPEETEGAVTAPDAPEEATTEITVAFPLPVEPRPGVSEDAPLLLRVDY